MGGDGVHLSTACMDCGVDVGSTGVPVEVVLGRVLVVSDIAGGVKSMFRYGKNPGNPVVYADVSVFCF